MESNTSGTYNTAIGTSAGVSSPSLSYATAIGAGAIVSQSNSMVLGGSLGANSVKVGIGTGVPTTRLDVVARDVADGIRIRGQTGGGGVVAWNPAFFLNDGSTERGTLGLAEQDGAYSTSALTGDIVLRSMTHKLLLQNGNGASTLAITGNKVGIGTVTNVTNILTVQQNSPTDPIADAWTTYSSRRWKTNIQTIENALGKVQKLRGVTYDWKADGKHDIGLIAEEVGEVIPEVVQYEENGVDARSVDYPRLVSVLIEAVKEQQKTITNLNAENNNFARRLSDLELVVRSLAVQKRESSGSLPNAALTHNEDGK